ncbi:FK506-binding protein 15-like [Actinia tenebrosa]|uniref:FK506-binding protein 15-like n=1 Tax=Actinia tenebrosa TaxID=6105 RepID=A0A6P8ITD4_ACTTE|nr:FK506-binding protein 15-like [Actinia tenebrosa]XP_031570475.1 FK506-binding protein 15-like [Actinia tenebrosa]XP_031570476.1 FK506-binding protein 15-like [Actinia tenebrosa]
MLKRIRKISKQKASGKEQEEMAKSKDKAAGNSLDDTMTALLSERDSLLEEVKKLKEQLQNENVRYAELKSLKTQQVCALTFKLAKAMRDKERAIEENDSLKQELLDIRSTRQVREESVLENRSESVPLDVVEVKQNSIPLEEPQLYRKINDSDKNIPCEKMSCFIITGEPIHKERCQKGVQEEVKQNLVEKSVVGGEPREPPEDASQGDENSDCSSSDTLSLSQCSFKSDEQNTKKKVMVEFRRIQKELLDVKKNMSMVQGLNERLSRDLQSLVDKKNSHPLVRSQSLRMRKNGSSDFPHDNVDGKRENLFVFPVTETTKKDQAKTTQDASTETEVCGLEQIDGLQKKNESQDERIEQLNQESLEEIPGDGLPVELESADCARSKDGDDKEIQANVIEVRKQLEKAMKELEELRADNKEMKKKINNIAFATDHGDFLRKTTQFTGALLKEMREREQKIERKTSRTTPKVKQPPLSVLGTRLNEITKTVDDMTKPDSTLSSLESVCVTSTVESALMTEPIPRPHSAGLPTTHIFSRQVDAKVKPLPEPKKRRFTTGKLGEPSLAYRHVGLISNDGGLKRLMEPLAKEWRSTETLSPRHSFSGPLGYKDYIQRHIVMSSNAIAKIRDLTPEELNGHIVY